MPDRYKWGWTYCPDCEAEEYVRPTDCCDGLKPWCQTVELLDGAGDVDVVVCREEREHED